MISLPFQHKPHHLSISQTCSRIDLIFVTFTGMQSLMQQMSDNPQLMQNMMNAPYTQNMFQSLAQNPDLASNIISSNPLFAGNPQLQEQMRNMMPAMLQQMQSPAVQGLMTNPEALQVNFQIFRGMRTNLEKSVLSGHFANSARYATASKCGT